MPRTCVLGVSALYHDSAAALVVDGTIVAAAQEERFSRIKNDSRIPVGAIEFCLKEGGVVAGELATVAYYEKPITSLVRSLKTMTAVGATALAGVSNMLSSGLGRQLLVAYSIEQTLRRLGHPRPERMVYAEHHVSHAAAAFYPSPFDRAAVLTFDGVGEWATSTIGHGSGRSVDLLIEQRFPASIGLLYAAFTQAAGFMVNSGEYKLMGLAPFGQPRYAERILDHLVDLRDDGSFTIDTSYFGYLAGRRMTNRRFSALFDGPARKPEAPITRRECDLARSIQDVTEEIVLRTARHAHQLTGETNVVLGGGVALNCVANGRLLREGPFEQVWVQPAPGDAGSAVGCALWAWHEILGQQRGPVVADAMGGSFLGPRPTDGDVASFLRSHGWDFEQVPDAEDRAERVARLLADGGVVAICNGRMEYGPRALGNRSILADPRTPGARSRLNEQTKHRESFRPFAPVVLRDRVADWFDFDGSSPYMSFVAEVKGARTRSSSPPGRHAPNEIMDLMTALEDIESPLPAVTHVDGTARIQTADRDRHPELHRILRAFDELTGCPVLLNTSFNVRGEPIVAHAADAYRCFMTTDVDWLLIDDCILARSAQPAWQGAPTTITPD